MSNAADVVLPREQVALRSMRDRAGEPVRVWCERIGEVEVLRIVRALPGLYPTTRDEREASQPTDATEEQAGQLLEYAEPLIEIGCRFDDGSQAFWFRTEVEGALPGRLLSDADKLALFQTIMTLCGFVGGAAEDLRFPDGVGAGLGDGLAAVEVERGGDAAAGARTVP